MKKVISVLATVAFMAAVVSCQAPVSSNSNVAAADSVSASIAYINTDSLLIKYEYAKKLSDEIMSKEESSRANFNQKARVFQQDAIEFQRKVQNNGFLSLERAQKEEQRLQKVQQELAELEQSLTAELMKEQQRINMELRDTLNNFLSTFAAGKYKLILSNTMGDNVLYSAPGVDITNEVVSKLNERYSAKK